MKRLFWQFILMLFLAAGVRGQSAVEYFTNQANELLQAQFGFGVTNIPVYCTTNPAVGYGASLHYDLQSVANAYDATTPPTCLPSVFRPLFAWQSGTLYIIGYAGVSNDFQSQIAPGLKNIDDPAITTNDNVWGVPWVIGTKGDIPAFNEYCYASEIFVDRFLEFLRFPSATRGVYITNRPPQYTNQYYIMSISNSFGAEAWNFSSMEFTHSVTIVISNQISISLTNGYGFCTNLTFTNSTNGIIDSWAAGHFNIPLLMNTVSLPSSYWSESTGQFVPLANVLNGILASDTKQTGWPVHQWTLKITNSLMYALIDNDTGHVLDFVNLAPFGSSINIMQTLTSLSSIWDIAPATDSPNSPMSGGAIREILDGMSENLQFALSLLGAPGGYPASVGSFFAPSGGSPGTQSSSPAFALFLQSCSWQAANPLVHYTVADLANQLLPPGIETIPSADFDQPISLDNSPCSLGKINPDYNSGTPEYFNFDLSDGSFQIGFLGANDLPYQIWASTNLIDWSQIGTAAQPEPGCFQFEDPATSDYPARFYQVRLP